jgi:hypothetical protein
LHIRRHAIEHQGATAVIPGAYTTQRIRRFEICRGRIVGWWEELETISLLDGGNVLTLFFVVDGGAGGLEVVKFGFLDRELGMCEI